MKLSAATEGLFENEYQALSLPTIWKVIYHEGIRHNHILFSGPELLSIEKLLHNGNFRLTEQDERHILHMSSKAFSTDDFAAVRQLIGNLTEEQRAVFFVLYKRALSHWSQQLRASLH